MKNQVEVSLNMNVRGLGQSATIAINDRSRALQREGKEVYRLGLGQSPFPIPLPVVDALKVNAHVKDYLPARGLPALREMVADYHRRTDGLPIHPENVLVGPGSKELMFILQIVYYGELVVPTPCWVSYVPQARIVGRTISLIPTTFEDRWKVSAAALEKHCDEEDDDGRPRILVLNYPGNPDGCDYTTDQLKEIAEVARKYGVILLSDEIYGPLHHSGEHVSVARYYPEGTIISSGLSKWCGAGGWRLGTFAFPPDLQWLLDKMAVVASETYTSVCAPVQYAAVRAFKGGRVIERSLAHSRRILKCVGGACADMLAEAGARIHQPDGAFYLFPDFGPLRERLAERGIEDSPTLCEKLLQDTGVAILPGVAFERPPEELTARIAYVDFDGARALVQSESLPLDSPIPEGKIETCCGHVLKAIRLLCDWLKG